jgi:class 3 adenylate cyclase/CHASE2 domain-containing sensor protein
MTAPEHAETGPQRRPGGRFSGSGSGPWRLRWRGLAGWGAALAGILVAGADGRAYGVGARLDAAAFDAQVRLIRALRPAAPPASEADVVLVGLDDASLDGLHVPLSLIHAPLGLALAAIAGAHPRAIGLDIALPERSFDAIVPGVDRALMLGLESARAAGPFALALDADADGHLRIPYAPLLAAAGGAQAFGAPLFPLDCDGVVRRYDPDPGRPDATGPADCLPGSARVADTTARIPTIAGRLAQQLGVPAPLPGAGWIDYTRGPAFSYIPFQAVLDWQRSDARATLRERFGGRIVLVGSVLPYVDRLRLPVALASWEDPGVPPPGLIANAQVVRNALGHGLVQTPAPWLAWATVLVLAGAGLPSRAVHRYALLAGLLCGGFALGAALLWAGTFLAPGSAMVAGATALAVRTALELSSAHRARDRLARRVSGYLSPAVLRAIEDDSLDDAGARRGVRRSIALLFADLQDFTRRSENTDPEHIRALLNRYYAAVTPGLHAHGGMIDNFRGDGIMVLFGAPAPLERPCDTALAAAGQMLARISRLNEEELAPHGIEPIGLTMGLAFGEVVFGELGSPERRDFTALGDAVNVAAHLQSLAKQAGYPVLMSDVFAGNLAARPDTLVSLGLQPIKGHTPLRVFGWTPVLTANH